MVGLFSCSFQDKLKEIRMTSGGVAVLGTKEKILIYQKKKGKKKGCHDYGTMCYSYTPRANVHMNFLYHSPIYYHTQLHVPFHVL